MLKLCGKGLEPFKIVKLPDAIYARFCAVYTWFYADLTSLCSQPKTPEIFDLKSIPLNYKRLGLNSFLNFTHAKAWIGSKIDYFMALKSR
jgi:hypothetical protein